MAAIPVLLAAYVTSAWIQERRVLRDRSTSPWAARLVGWGIRRVLALIPIAGALVGVAATVVGLGALAVALWRAARPVRLRRGRKRRLQAVPHQPLTLLPAGKKEVVTDFAWCRRDMTELSCD